MTPEVREALAQRLKTTAMAATDFHFTAALVLFQACADVLLDKFPADTSVMLLEDMVRGARDGARDAGVSFAPTKPALVQ